MRAYMNNLKEYKVSATDWRAELLKNQQNTRNVIILFLLTYMMVGLVIDTYLNLDPHQSIKNIALELITFQIIPLATLIMVMIGLVSIFITYKFHDKIVMLGTDYVEITRDNAKSIAEKQLYNVTEELKIAAGLAFMPKIYIIEADYMNAFASGYSEKSALVAITRGLLEKLDRDELQAVMAHELSHIRHNDIRLTLTVAVLSNLILIAIDLVFRGVLFGGGRNKDNRLVTIIVLLRFLLPIFTVILMLYLSRKRELMADSGSVELLRNNQPLARALLKINSDYSGNKDHYEKEYAETAHEDVRRASYLYDPAYAGISAIESINSLFSTHPSLEERLKALGIEKKRDIKNDS